MTRLASASRWDRPTAASSVSHVVTAPHAILILFLFLATITANAGGPRWEAGPPYFTTWHTMVSWYTNQPLYFTDPADLSPSVNHAAADAIVARAAAVWNIPTASISLAQGGTLAEHISGANVYPGPNGPVFPADVQTSNYASKQIAIIYDTDGSISDLLLGSGASDPSACLQNGVIESVDSITPQAQILHALLIVNGRCTGAAPEKQLQLQYQLERAFGRILGLGWSQTNDNVFTGVPVPTHTQALNWPIMHPIDIVCGSYTYQCLPDPFTLRPDDISSLGELYYVQQGQGGIGKIATWSSAGGLHGSVTFPNGQGMEGVNVTVRRRAPYWNTAEDWQTASSTSGYTFRVQGSTPISAAGSSVSASLGTSDAAYEGYWGISSIPVPADEAWSDLVVSTEPINPLYTGAYSVGPQTSGTISPSGSPQVQVSPYLAPFRYNSADFYPPDAASTCATQMDGSEAAPAPLSQGGWWTGTLCGYGHVAWNSLAVRANRTLTVETTALDEQGFVTSTKMMPTLGAWKSTDPTGTLPTVRAAGIAFNSISVGMTTLSLQSSAATIFRIAIADQRGAGRPDFAYQARVLYADSISPASIPAGGGTITISGMGFRQGNTVLINGVAAVVSSWTANTIVATAPTLHTLGLSRATSASITVKDLSTGGSSVMSAALAYAAPVEALLLVSAPSGTVTSGSAIATAFAVKAIAPDGFTPIVGESVSFTASGAGALLSPCNLSTCTVLTNAAGIASTSVTPTSAGNVALAATGRSGSAAASFTATASADRLQLLSSPTGMLTTGRAASAPLRIQLLASDGVTPRSGYSITLSMVAGQARLGACASLPCTLATDASGIISTTFTPLSSGTLSIQIVSPTSTISTPFFSAAETTQIVTAPAATLAVGTASPTPFSIKVVAGDGVFPVPGEPIVFTAIGSSIIFGACGGAVCTVATDAQGIAQTSVTAASAGSVTLTAAGNAGSATTTFTAVTRTRSITSARPVLYIAEGAAVTWQPQFTLSDNLGSVANLPVVWTGAQGLSSLAAISTSDAGGLATGATLAGPLMAGVRTQGVACAWDNICFPFAAQAVSSNDWHLTVVSGASQTVSSRDSLSSVVLQVADAYGDPIAGAPVQVVQTISGWEQACAPAGRCPLASVIASSQASLVSDIDGRVVVVPAEVGNTPGVTSLAIITGTQGFATISLQRHL